ncbi:MAG: hypothetical protein SGILL_000366 [Bacillariaceae sp.]
MTMERRKRPRSSSAVAFKPKEDDHRKAFSNNFPRRKSSTAKISLRFRDLSLLLFTAVSTVILPAHVSGASPNTREILEQLYDATNGDGWKENKNWKSTEDVCSWQGVHCDNNGGEVIRVELDRNNLSGDIPPEFWKLPKLKHVNMRSNLLTDGGFDGLAASTSENSDPQGSRSPIQLLILSENQLTSLEGIGNAKDTLQFVNLNKNQIDASIPDEVFQLTNLKTLYLAFNQLTSTLPTGIGKLTKLTEVYAFRNRLSGQLPSELGLLDKCQILGLGNNLWSGTLPTELNDMVNLRDLSIHNNGHGHEASTGVESDAPPEHLEPAGISGPLLSFGNVPYLGLLYLDGNDLSGTIPPDFLRHNNNTDSPVSVGLSSNNITGEIPKALERFESLSLDLVGNSIDSIPPELCEKGGWMGGLVEEYKCDAIMCPIGTYSSEGRQIGTDSECRKCDDEFPYFGASQCFSDDANQQPWEVLAFFYLSTGGDKWENKDGWEIFDNLFNGETLEELEQIDVDICNGWYGILCRDGVPERLSLPKNNLFGVVPNMIFHIDWSVFDLSDNNVEFESLSAVPKTVESLILSNAKVRSLDGIAGLSNLEQLYLDGLEIQGELPNALFALTELKTLHLQHGKFQGPLSSAIGSLVNLEVLNIYGNALSGKLPSEIGALARLRALDLSENRFTGTLPNEIAKLTNITNFALHQTKGSLGGPLPAFDTLPLLKGLYLQSNGFTGQIAENFIGGINDKTSEIVISLSSNQLTGSIPPSLVKFDNLILDLENNGITELDSTICVHDQWMRGELGNLPQASRCNGILCPPGTWNAFGKETAEEKCRECSEGSENFGQTRCGDEQEKSHEKEILDRLFAMTGGRYWTKPHENWLKPGASVCEREGIVCSGSGDEEHVHEIALNDFGLRGTIPTSIWELSHANRLKFSFNAVSVSFEGIAKASRLRILDMSYCHLRSLEGIEDAPSELVEIHFTANQFQGSIPAEIFELTSLNRLFLNNNHFTSRIPPDVSKLTGLDTILLGGNKFTGAVPSEIGLMTSLQVLGLAQNDLFGNLPSEIENLSLLKNLYLSQQNGNQFDGPFPSFSKNSKLVTIDASGNSFSGSLPKDFLIMVDPRAHIEVNLANNAFVGSIPESWSLFETLDIDLSGNQLTALPEKLCSENGWNGGRVGLLDTCDAILCPPGTHLTGLGRQVEPLEPCQACEQGVESAPFYGTRDCLDPKLVWERKILVSFYEATNGTSWLSQRNWLSLKPVCIWYGIVCDENGFVETVQLEDNFLVSGREQIEDVSNILTLRELKTLDLKGNELVLDFEAIKTDKTKLVFLRLSGVGLSSLEGISKAANLKALHVTNNQITAIPDELYSMDSLESVFLSFNSIKGPISPKIGQLTNLIELYLFGNFLSGTIPTEIGLMTSLAEFVAAHNLLSGDLPDQISFLPNLEQLSMYSQQGIEMLKGPIPSFSGAPRLWYFDASDNALTGPVPDNFLINSIHLNETVTVLLQDNQITGTIPRELSKFNLMDINLAGNAIERIPEALCSIDGWMQGDVGRIGNCSAILCPRGTFNQFGYHSPEYPCLECSHLVDIEMLGQTHCENFTSERDTLEKFFDDTGGEFWLNSTNWNTEAPICSWFGILCEDGDVQDSEGVTHIKLESNGLDGELSSEIWTLPALRSLKLDGNEALFMNLKGIANAADTLEVLTLAHVKMPFVEGLGSLTSLKKLSLAGNELTGKHFYCALQIRIVLCKTYPLTLLVLEFAGTFPDELFMLSNSLESLYIGFNLLYGPLPTRLGEMTQLQVFNAFNNDFFSTIPTEVASMENLRTLGESMNSSRLCSLSHCTIPLTYYDRIYIYIYIFV